MIQLTGQFVPVKLNAEKAGSATAQKYGVQGFPTILFINSAGEVEGRIPGYLPPQPFAEEIKKIADAHRDFPKMEARVKDNPKDVEATAKLAAIYAGRGNGDRASALLEQAEKEDPQNASGHLTKAYNAVGDYFQLKQEFDKAVPLFRKAADTGKDPYDINYARISIASCYLSQRKLEEAKPELEAIVNDAHAPADLKSQAQQILDELKKRSGS